MAQNQQFASALACKLVKENYGEVCERICRHILAKGSQTLPDIIRGSGLPPALAKQGLLVLIQHNLVSAYLNKDDDSVKSPRPPFHTYEPNVDRMLQIIRMPKFMLHIKEEMGEEAERIIEVLLQMGRLSLDQVVKAVAGRLQQDPGEVQEHVRNTFISLVQSHYVERAPPATLPPPTVSNHPNSIKKRSAKAGTEQAAQEQAQSLKRIEEMWYEKARFKLPQELIIEAMMEGVDGPAAAAAKEEVDDGVSKPPPAKKARIKAGTKSVAAAEKAGAADKKASVAAQLAAAESAMPQPSVLLWRVNYEEFNRRFRHKACVDMVSDKIDTDAGSVMAAMLTASRPFENRLKEERSACLSVEEVAVTTMRLVDSGVLPKPNNDVHTIINTIAHDALELISYIGNGPSGEQYVVNMSRIVELIRLKQIEAVIRDRFGVSGLRIFRLLLLKGQLEQKQIADFAMLPQKDTRELLYRMMRGGFLALQDIPRTSDRAPSRTFYTFRANYEGAGDQLASELYRAAGNVWMRIRHEMDREKELLSLVEEAQMKGELHFNLTAAQRSTLHRLKRVSEVLQASLMQLDDMISIFNNF
mmetsp:Transcript_28003/g.61450  ORF Transcript_28003/g.61450 Transcript_28003/m.61450 type:complete len:586 (+) Transcript_28003:89-1846(+)|eukprot:CAMPEP_0202910662 /NCGR_PEP_ID=MMETSP1392-20130828/52636_1 /ASSEMBLY_ACC=CAM_ASM_000868 /TAXON_ID=225041 /ORGANISM="Chlamydomonas chlamydogama, Strain SAG 11-48b" /LENGTH=585 /DNA_ID=CAMNT_0049600833 /DNA_START=37 /DNA_END=1794 /DNA_ORIENTATION=+